MLLTAVQRTQPPRKVPHLFVDFNHVWIFAADFYESPKIKFLGYPSCGSPVDDTCGQADRQG
jgi:hypothetical protein